MKKMFVVSIQGKYVYTLRDDATGDTYIGNFEFMDVDDPPVVGDVILWSSNNCTDPEECRKIHGQCYLGTRTYGPYTTAGYMRTGQDMTEMDVMIVVKPDDAYLLHRYYG